MAGTSRMSREAHVRICGGLEVRLLRSTRPARSGHSPDKKNPAWAGIHSGAVILGTAPVPFASTIRTLVDSEKRLRPRPKLTSPKIAA